MTQLQSQARDTANVVEAIARRIEEISTLPAVALQVMKKANDPESGAVDLTEIMQSDTSLSARVLRCVNSSAYAVRQKITNLQQAIAYLGSKQIRNLAITASVSDLFKTDEKIGPYQRSGLWRHLVSVGIAARMLAVRCGIDAAEDIFLAGLLHDIGIILEDQHIHRTFCKIIGALSEKQTLAAVERSQMTFDHSALGEQVGNIWGFPDGVKAAIRYHHMSNSYRGHEAEMVRCVEVANILCSQKGITSVGIDLVTYSRPAFSSLKLGKGDLPDLEAELDAELDANAGLFCV